MRKTDNEPEHTEEVPAPQFDPDSPAERFYGSAISRILRFTLIFGAVGALLGFGAYGIRAGLGFLLGLALAYWNFRSLASTVNALGERIVVGQSKESGGVVVFRLISRILLVGLAGYAIFLSSPGSLKGFLVGLCTPVPALMWEAGYEGYAALRRGL
jgi:hypothetical protein